MENQLYRKKSMDRISSPEELCSAVFEKAFTKMDRFDPTNSAVGTWIFSITQNALITIIAAPDPRQSLTRI